MRRSLPLAGKMPPVRASDGTDLSLRRWPAPDAAQRRGTLLLLHGLGDHCGRYAHVADALTPLGLDVVAYDHRGHGRSEGVRGGLPHPDALLDDLKLVYDSLGEEAFLLGHSLGGTVAARAVSGGWVAPRALILSSPALAV